MDGRQIWNVMRCVLSLKRTKINLELKISIIIMRHLKLKSLFHETKGQFHQDRFYCILEILMCKNLKRSWSQVHFNTFSKFQKFLPQYSNKVYSYKKGYSRLIGAISK